MTGKELIRFIEENSLQDYEVFIADTENSEEEIISICVDDCQYHGKRAVVINRQLQNNKSLPSIGNMIT